MNALLALLLCIPPAGQVLDLREGTLTATVVHKLHEVHATTRQLEGRALVKPDGTAQVQVRAKIASFDSGNSNRDVHMREVTHDAEHQYASVKGTLAGVGIPLAAPLQTTLHAAVELNGQKHLAEIPVKLEPAGAGVRATFSFPLSLDAFKVERPELLFVKVDDTVVIAGDLLFGAAP